MKPQKNEVIRRLNLIEHPEGGYYNRTYRCRDEYTVDNKKYGDGVGEIKRNASTAILYLLGHDEFSAWHSIKSDEIWHYYCGASVTIRLIGPDKPYQELILGNILIDDNAMPQIIIPANTWFCASPNSNADHDFSLVGCTVSPGFTFLDFKLAKPELLIKEYPDYADVIKKYCRNKPKVPIADHQHKIDNEKKEGHSLKLSFY